MSNKKKKGHRETDLKKPRQTMMPGLGVGLPDKLQLLGAVDATGLRLLKAEISRLGARFQELQRSAAAPQKVEVVPSAVLQAFAYIATNVWRAKAKMIDTETGEPTEEMRRVYRHIEAIAEALKQIGVETVDPAGRAYDTGMALKVVAFEPTPGVTKEEIKETIKPTVIWQGRLIQVGEVIVAKPETA